MLRSEVKCSCSARGCPLHKVAAESESPWSRGFHQVGIIDILPGRVASRFFDVENYRCRRSSEPRGAARVAVQR